MNTAHLHLILNHIPIIGTLGAILIIVYGLIRKNRDTELLGAFLLIILAFVSFAVISTGEAAEEVAEQIPGISEAAMEAHENAAKIAHIIMVISGVWALATVVMHFRKHTSYRVLLLLALTTSVASFGAMAYTGFQGGKIRHTEFYQSSPLPASESPEEEDD